MPELLFDIHLEIDPLQLAKERDATQTIAELSRRAAEDHALEHRLTLRHPDPREVHTARALDPLTGTDVFLVATRWLADPL